MGRKSKLTSEVQEKVVQALQGGNYFNTACRYAGISPGTGWSWIERGEAENPKRPRKDIFVLFANAIREAEAEVEIRMVAQWRTQMPEDWRAIQMFMERRYPERWGRKERQEHVGAGGGPLEVSFMQLAKEAAEEEIRDHNIKS